MRIAISGLSGCGNTTVSGIVAARLGYDNINFTFRNLAREKGVSFARMCQMARQDDSYDIELDRRQVELAMERENCVLASRLAIWMLKDADLRFYLDVSLKERARRIHEREGGSYEQKLAETDARDRSDSERYRRIYGIDNTNPASIADHVIRGDAISAESIASLIVAKVEA